MAVCKNIQTETEHREKDAVDFDTAKLYCMRQQQQTYTHIGYAHAHAYKSIGFILSTDMSASSHRFITSFEHRRSWIFFFQKEKNRSIALHICTHTIFLFRCLFFASKFGEL